MKKPKRQKHIRSNSPYNLFFIGGNNMFIDDDVKYIDTNKNKTFGYIALKNGKKIPFKKISVKEYDKIAKKESI